MTAIDGLIPVLDQIELPIFAVQKAVAIYGNPAFRLLQVGNGERLDQFYKETEAIHEPGQNTVKKRKCTVAGQRFIASISPVEDADLYVLQPAYPVISSQLLANVANSLRLPLHTVYNAVSRICREMDDHEERLHQALTSSTLKGIYQMERVIQNMDVLQKLICEERVMKREKIDIVQFLHEIFSEAQDLLRYTNITCTLHMPDKMFSGYLDREMVSAALWNLLSNAGQNSLGGRIIIRVSRMDEMLRINITDSSRGIEPRVMPDLFARYRVPLSETLGCQGAGLGLTLARTVALQHGGNLMLSTGPNGNVTSSISFSIAKPVTNEVPVQFEMTRIEGGLDKGLVGLSNVLPREAFDSRDIL